jgi:hypothetical protein
LRAAFFAKIGGSASVQGGLAVVEKQPALTKRALEGNAVKEAFDRPAGAAAEEPGRQGTKPAGVRRGSEGALEPGGV